MSTISNSPNWPIRVLMYKIEDREPMYDGVFIYRILRARGYNEACKEHGEHWNYYHMFSRNTTSGVYHLTGEPRRWHLVQQISSGDN